MKRLRRLLLPALLWGVAGPLPAAAFVERGRVVSVPDCPGAADFVAEAGPAPRNRTFMRVQFMGDPGTGEREGAVATPVQWDVGTLTGLHVPPAAQRGHRDEGLPVGATAFQLACEGAGFLINTWQFSHKVAVSGGGPSASIVRDLDPPAPFGNGIVLNVRARVPWMLAQQPPVDDGTAQLSFMYYLMDRKSGIQVAHIISLYDNRPAGVGGSGVESLGFDGDVLFIGSPLAEVDGSGEPVRFVSPPTAGSMRYGAPWSEAIPFRAVVTAGNLREALAVVRAADPRLSANPADYEVISFGVLAEVFPGTSDAHNVSFAGSIDGLTLGTFESAFTHRPR